MGGSRDDLVGCTQEKVRFLCSSLFLFSSSLITLLMCFISVLPYEVCPPHGVSLCVANILIGQLVRPSMVAAIVTNLEEGGLLCLSGIRPGEVDSLKEAYEDNMEWIDDQYAELSASETVGCIESYGFDCGRWARLVGRKKIGDDSGFIAHMSELAVS